MNNNYKNLINIHILFFFIIFLFYNSTILSNFIWRLPLFTDFNIPINWLECHNLGHNLFTVEKVDCGTNKNILQFNYGKAFLHVPYNETLDFFYRNILPWILIYLFIFTTFKVINPKDLSGTVLVYLSILNPSTLLLLERMQLDCFFYLAIIFIVYNRIYLINWLIGIYFALIKFYPISILITVFIENKERSIKSICIIILFLSILFFGYLYLNYEFYYFMVNNMLPGKAGYHFLYSLNALSKIFKYIFNIKYQLLLILFYSFFIYLIIKVVANFNKNKEILKSIKKSLFTVESKLFLISGYFNIFLFILVSSYVYKEVYLILSLPLILWLKHSNKSKFFYYLYYMIIFRFLYLFLYSFFNINDGIIFVNNIRVFSNYFLITISIKAILDFILLCILFSILYIKSKLYLLHIIKKNVHLKIIN